VEKRTSRRGELDSFTHSERKFVNLGCSMSRYSFRLRGRGESGGKNTLGLSKGSQVELGLPASSQGSTMVQIPPNDSSPCL
jgi:hypothetical protein